MMSKSFHFAALLVLLVLTLSYTNAIEKENNNGRSSTRGRVRSNRRRGQESESLFSTTTTTTTTVANATSPPAISTQHGGDDVDDDDDDDDDGEECVDPLDAVVDRTFGNIQLLPDAVVNEVSIPFALGIANISMQYQPLCDIEVASRYMVCLEISIYNTDITTLDIRKGFINEATDSMSANFSPQISTNDNNDSFYFTGCVDLTEDMWLDLIRNPDVFYIRAGTDSGGSASIRSQLLTSFRNVPLSNDQVVEPFNSIDSDLSNGMASLFVQKGGTEVCFDVTLDGYNPDIGYVNRGLPDTNGVVVMDFSSTKVEGVDGKFMGCMQTEDELGLRISDVVELLSDGYLYYFTMHLADRPPAFFRTTRGQIPNPGF